MPPPRLPRLSRRLGIGLIVLALAGAANLLWLGAASAQDASDEPAPDAALIDRGEELYGAHCALCHGAEGVGLDQSGPSGGPALRDVGAASVDFMLRTGRMPAFDQRDRLIRRPPAFSPSEREALIAYITSLGEQSGPEIPEIDGWEDADLSKGLELFTSNCAACHGPTAAGIAVGQRDVSSNLSVASPLEIAEAIRTGPGVMPVFSDEVMTQEQLEEVVAWVMELRDRESPGGVSIGRSGPVSEGVIAWLVGMGLLGIVMYLLGEKASDASTHGETDG